MSTDIAVRHEPTSALAIRPDQTAWRPEQRAALVQLGVQDAPEGDLAVFLNQAQRTGLDPFLRQIYMIGRWSREGTKYTIQTGIDGLRIVAQRSGEYAGQTEPEWCGEDGVWKTIWLKKWGRPVAARVGVYRKGFAAPLYGVALFEEYAQTKKDGNLTQMWAEKGFLMLAKCAEALALRKAFPQDLSGLYTAEEMSKADEQAAAFAPTAAPAPALAQGITPQQSKAFHAAAGDLFDDDERKEYLVAAFGVSTSKDLTAQQASEVIRDLGALGRAMNEGTVDRGLASKLLVKSLGGNVDSAKSLWFDAGLAAQGNPEAHAFLQLLRSTLRGGDSSKADDVIEGEIVDEARAFDGVEDGDPNGIAPGHLVEMSEEPF